MQYNLYKPNTKNTGCAFSFKIITKDKEGNPSKPTFLIQAIKQASWDSNKRTGSFSANAKDPEKNIYCKINENEAGDSLFMLIDGHVSIRSKEIQRNSSEIAQLKRGDIFGEMTVFAGTPRSATIQSIGKVDVLEVNRQAIAELFNKNLN